MYNDFFSTVLAKQWKHLLNRLQVLLDEDDDPYLEDHWLTMKEQVFKCQNILSRTQQLNNEFQERLTPAPFSVESLNRNLKRG